MHRARPNPWNHHLNRQAGNNHYIVVPYRFTARDLVAVNSAVLLDQIDRLILVDGPLVV